MALHVRVHADSRTEARARACLHCAQVELRLLDLPADGVVRILAVLRASHEDVMDIEAAFKSQRHAAVAAARRAFPGRELEVRPGPRTWEPDGRTGQTLCTRASYAHLTVACLPAQMLFRHTIAAKNTSSRTYFKSLPVESPDHLISTEQLLLEADSCDAVVVLSAYNITSPGAELSRDLASHCKLLLFSYAGTMHEGGAPGSVDVLGALVTRLSTARAFLEVLDEMGQARSAALGVHQPGPGAHVAAAA